jgi:hypothetical protein
MMRRLGGWRVRTFVLATYKMSRAPGTLAGALYIVCCFDSFNNSAHVRLTMTTPMLPVISRPRRQFASEEETSSSVQLDRRAWRERDNGRRRARSESPPRSGRRILEPHEFRHVFIRHGGRADDNGWYQYPVDAVTKGRPWPAELTRRQKEYHDAQDGIKKIKDDYLEEKRNAVKRCQILNLKKTLLTDQLSALEHETLLWKAKDWYLAAKRYVITTTFARPNPVA